MNADLPSKLPTNIPDNEKDLIEEILRRRRAGVAEGLALPAEKVRLFLTQVGEEIAAVGTLTEERAQILLHQLKNGES